MKIYFGLVDSDEIDSFGEEGLCGPDSNGQFYGQYVEFGTNAGGFDEVAIGDGCGRMVPVCVETLPDLITALQEVVNNVEIMASAKALRKQIKSGMSAYVEDEEVFWDDFQESFQGTGW